MAKLIMQKSIIKNVLIGGSQGSKLAATLFIRFINGISKLLLKSIPQFYADEDDGLFIFNSNKFKDHQTDMNHSLELIKMTGSMKTKLI